MPAAPGRSTVTADQRARWDAAVAAATARPAAASPSAAAALVSERLPIDQWPATLWFYSEEPPRTVQGVVGQRVVIDRPYLGFADGRYRFRPVAVPPGTPRAHFQDVLGLPPSTFAEGRDPLAHWVAVDMTYFRLMAVDGPPPRLYRELLPSGEYRYTLETWHPEIRIGSGHALVNGQRP